MHTAPRSTQLKCTDGRIVRGAGALLLLGLLGACKGGDATFASGGNVPAPTPGGAGVLSSYYVQSFAPYETLAARLRNSTARYVVQNSTWHKPSAPSVTYDSYPLAAARIEYAHAVGLTGAGQTVAVIDEGFRLTHETLSGKQITATGSPAVASHGTSVAAIIAGSSGTMIGVAPGAALHVADFNDINTMAIATQAALAKGAVAQNNSWGYSYDASAASLSALSAEGPAYVAALHDYAAQGVVVFAVSNTDYGSSRLMEALPSLDSSLEAGWLAVGNAVANFDNNNVYSAKMISSPCYETARWCLVADGAWTSATSTSNTSYGFGIGSSYATPQVSGALALLAEAFPNLSPHELRLRLLASANNSFFTPDGSVELVSGFSHDYSTTYGHGFLDLRAALLPIGVTTMTTGDGEKIATGDLVVRTGSAMGDAVAQSLSNVDVAVTDSFSGGFAMPGEALVATAAPAPMSAGLISKSLSRDLAGDRLSVPTAIAGSFNAHGGQTLDVPMGDGSASASILMPTPDAGPGIALTQTLGEGSTRLDLGLKVATDAGRVVGFGSSSSGAPRSNMAAVQIGLSQDLAGGGFLSLGGEIGVANIGTPRAFTDVSAARFDSVALELGRKNAFTKGDRISFGVSMPLAVTGGEAKMALRTVMAEGAPQVQSVGIDLAPSDRQMDFALSYSAPLGDGEELMMKLLHAENFGNRAGNSDTAAVLAYTWRF